MKVALGIYPLRYGEYYKKVLSFKLGLVSKGSTAAKHSAEICIQHLWFVV